MESPDPRQAWLTEITQLMQQTPLPRPASTIRRFLGRDYCTLCELEVTYCRCGTTPAQDAPPTDGAESSLAARVRELRSGR